MMMSVATRRCTVVHRPLRHHHRRLGLGMLILLFLPRGRPIVANVRAPWPGGRESQGQGYLLRKTGCAKDKKRVTSVCSPRVGTNLLRNSQPNERPTYIRLRARGMYVACGLLAGCRVHIFVKRRGRGANNASHLGCSILRNRECASLEERGVCISCVITSPQRFST